MAIDRGRREGHIRAKRISLFAQNTKGTRQRVFTAGGRTGAAPSNRNTESWIPNVQRSDLDAASAKTYPVRL